MTSTIFPVWAARLARRLARFGPNLLLMLPATDRSVALARALSQQQDCWIVKGQIFDALNASDPLLRYLRSPGDIVRLTAGRSELERPVISMPELIVGDGPSFVQTEFLGEMRYFSVVESLLFARHAPHVLSVHSCFGNRAYRLHHVSMDTCDDANPTLSTLRNLLRPIEAEAHLKPGDWRANHSLAAKTEAGFSASLREDCRDLEALLRMMLLNKLGEEKHALGMLRAISTYVASSDKSSY